MIMRILPLMIGQQDGQCFISYGMLLGQLLLPYLWQKFQKAALYAGKRDAWGVVLFPLCLKRYGSVYSVVRGCL